MVFPLCKAVPPPLLSQMVRLVEQDSHARIPRLRGKEQFQKSSNKRRIQNLSISERALCHLLLQQVKDLHLSISLHVEAQCVKATSSMHQLINLSMPCMHVYLLTDTPHRGARPCDYGCTAMPATESAPHTLITFALMQSGAEEIWQPWRAMRSLILRRVCKGWGVGAHTTCECSFGQ
jgi:hypothetical protein